MISCWPNLLFHLDSECFLIFLLPLVWYVGLGFSDLQSVLTLSQPCTDESFLIIIIMFVSLLTDNTLLYYG